MIVIKNNNNRKMSQIKWTFHISPFSDKSGTKKKKKKKRKINKSIGMK